MTWMPGEAISVSTTPTRRPDAAISAGQVGRGVGLSRSAPKGMNRDGFRHYVLFVEVGRSIKKALRQVKDILIKKF